MTPTIEQLEAEKREIQKRIGNVNTYEIEWEIIVMLTAEAFGLTPETIFGRARPTYIGDARQVAIAMVRKFYPRAGSDAIGKFFDRDHSTILFAVRAVREKTSVDRDLKAKVDALEKILTTRFQNRQDKVVGSQCT